MTMAAVVTATAAKNNNQLKTKRCSGQRKAATMVVAEAREDNKDEREFDVA